MVAHCGDGDGRGAACSLHLGEIELGQEPGDAYTKHCKEQASLLLRNWKIGASTLFLSLSVCYHAAFLAEISLEGSGDHVSITEQHTEETLCLAHIYALAAMAGVNHSVKVHDYGVDGQFTPVVHRDNRRVDSGFPLDFQAKATVDWELVGDEIRYDLEAKNYNDIATRTPAETTIILILLCLPKNRTDWHSATCSETVLRHCCYWHKMSGEPTTNDTTTRIFIPRDQLLTPFVLNNLLAAERMRRVNQI